MRKFVCNFAFYALIFLYVVSGLRGEPDNSLAILSLLFGIWADIKK